MSDLVNIAAALEMLNAEIGAYETNISPDSVLDFNIDFEYFKCKYRACQTPGEIEKRLQELFK